MDAHLEMYNIDSHTVNGIIGETVHAVLDNAGSPIMSGFARLRGRGGRIPRVRSSCLRL